MNEQNSLDLAINQEVVFQDPNGFHARPVTLFVHQAKTFQAKIQVRYQQKIADAKSMIALLSLGVRSQSTLIVSAEGEDAQDAVKALCQAIEAGLEPPVKNDSKKTDAEINLNLPEITIAKSDHVFEGTSASPGISIAQAFKLIQDVLEIPEEKTQKSAEEEKFLFKRAVENATDYLQDMRDYIKQSISEEEEEAMVFEAHIEMLADQQIIDKTHYLIDKGNSAAWSWFTVFKAEAERLSKLDDAYIAARAIDMKDIGSRVLGFLQGKNTQQAKALPNRDIILITTDLTPSETASLDFKHIKAIATSKGGANSHTAILARAFGVPALVALGENILNIENDTPLILDAFHDQLIVNPDEKTQESAKALLKQSLAIDESIKAKANEPAVTKDGHAVMTFGNIASIKDIDNLLEQGGEGVGLMRSELIFLEGDHAPTEEEQYQILLQAAKKMGDKTLILRAFDIGGDKELPFMPMEHEANPFLGVRGFRLLLRQQELAYSQLRSIYRVAKECSNIKLMLPMITFIDEIRTAKAMAEEARIAVDAPLIEIGMMVEVPSSALLAEHFAKEVDFISIGTNDLTQYALAIDRTNPQLAMQASFLDPSVLRLIKMTADACQKNNILCAVCGNMASDPKAAALLVGLGVSELSMSPNAIALIKEMLRQQDFKKLQSIALVCLEKESTQAVKDYLKAQL